MLPCSEFSLLGQQGGKTAAMTEQELITLLTENVSFGLRHANYKRTVEVRKFAHMIATGKGQDEEVTRYRRFEHDTLKEQRKRLYNPLTKYALARPRKYWKNLTRVEGIRRTFEASDETALKELQNDFWNFMPGQDLETWLNKTLEYLGVTDPNAWIVYERNDQRNAEGQILKTTVYPFIVPSVDALNFERKFGVLQWLIARTTTIEQVVENGWARDKYLENFYLYAPGKIVRLREKGERTVREENEVEIDIEVFTHMESGDTSAHFDKAASASGAPRNSLPPAVTAPKVRTFYLAVFDNSTTEVPAECVGVYLDELTGQGFVPWFDPAEHVFKRLIRDTATSDVLTIVYAYPKTWEFVKRCEFESAELGRCEHGYLGGIQDRQHICPNCNGTGTPANFTTEQETLQIPLPEDPKLMLELSKLSFTQPVDIALLQHIDSKIEESEGKIMAAVFDSGLYQKPTNTKTRTATEVNAVMEGISDVLYPFCSTLSRHYELVHRVGSQYREFELSVDHSFPDDLKIESLPDMVATFDSIKNSGVGYESLSAQRRRIFQKQFEGDPAQQKRIEVRYKFRPFDDKSAEETAFILAGLSPLDPSRVLWTYWLEIFKEIEAENQEFADLKPAQQRKIVDTKVAEFTQRIQLADVSEPEPDFNTDNELQLEETAG